MDEEGNKNISFYCTLNILHFFISLKNGFIDRFTKMAFPEDLLQDRKSVLSSVWSFVSTVLHFLK